MPTTPATTSTSPLERHTVAGDREAKAATRKNDELGKDAFLSLLVAQMRNQDPMSPVDNSQFMSQMAQFSALEQTVNLVNATHRTGAMQELATASGLIGRHVTWQPDLSPDGNVPATESGVVTQVTVEDGEIMLVIGDKTLRLDQIVHVQQPEPGSPAPGDTAAPPEEPAGDSEQ